MNTSIPPDTGRASLPLSKKHHSSPNTGNSSSSSASPSPDGTPATHISPDSSVKVYLANADGLHPLWDEATIGWWLPVLGPTSCALLPLLYRIGADQESNVTAADLAFMSGIGVGQLAKTLGRLVSFHAVTSVEIGDELVINMNTHLQRVGSRMRASWPAWWGRAYDEAFPL